MIKEGTCPQRPAGHDPQQGPKGAQDDRTQTPRATIFRHTAVYDHNIYGRVPRSTCLMGVPWWRARRYVVAPQGGVRYGGDPVDFVRVFIKLLQTRQL